MAQKPSIPKGTRDFSPAEMAKRNYIFDTIKTVFALHGFRQIETPALENLSTLMGKYGEEGDKLLFKVLNSGDFLKNVADEQLQERNCPRLATMLCEKGLRYDLTVPFARFVVQHRNELQFPFKRFQIQPVWRADRPQKGGIANSINVMPTLSVPILFLMKSICCNSSMMCSAALASVSPSK